jgi:hypothetical protein
VSWQGRAQGQINYFRYGSFFFTWKSQTQFHYLVLRKNGTTLHKQPGQGITDRRQAAPPELVGDRICVLRNRTRMGHVGLQ